MSEFFICNRCQKKTISRLKYFVSVPIYGSCDKTKILDNVCLYCCFVLTDYYKDCIFY